MSELVAEVSVLLRELFEEELPCEIDGHGSWLHDEGPGIWYVTVKCASCEYVTTDLMCDRLKVRLATRELIFQCSKCDHEVEDAWESVVAVTGR